MRDAHLGKNIHRFLADRAATDNKWLDVSAAELSCPCSGHSRQSAIAMDKRVTQIKLVGHAGFPLKSYCRGSA